MSIAEKIATIGGRSLLKVKAYSPELLIFGGIGALVTGGVLAVKATPKVEEIKSVHGYLMEKTDEMWENPDKFVDENGEGLHFESEEEYKKEKVIITSRTALQYLKLYGPAITLGAAGVVSILCGANIMRHRNAAIMAAYKVLETGMENYRATVREELGEQKEDELYHGYNKKIVETKTTTKDGKEKTKKEEVVDVAAPGASKYARFFDSSSHQWSESPEYNLATLVGTEAHMNQLLRTRGHVFLNEVYDALDIPRTKEGAVVGWVYEKGGDNYIDFNIHEFRSEANRRFVNNLENVILLDFNVDGIIYDKI